MMPRSRDVPSADAQQVASLLPLFVKRNGEWLKAEKDGHLASEWRNYTVPPDAMAVSVAPKARGLFLGAPLEYQPTEIVRASGRVQVLTAIETVERKRSIALRSLWVRAIRSHVNCGVGAEIGEPSEYVLNGGNDQGNKIFPGFLELCLAAAQYKCWVFHISPIPLDGAMHAFYRTAINKYTRESRHVLMLFADLFDHSTPPEEIEDSTNPFCALAVEQKRQIALMVKCIREFPFYPSGEEVENLETIATLPSMGVLAQQKPKFCF